MYAIVSTKKYRKALKKLSQSGNKADIKKLDKVISILVSGKELPKKYGNHALIGDLSGYEECHIKGNLLLVYYKVKKDLVLVLVGVGNHDDLFR